MCQILHVRVEGKICGHCNSSQQVSVMRLSVCSTHPHYDWLQLKLGVYSLPQEGALTPYENETKVTLTLIYSPYWLRSNKIANYLFT